MKSKNKLLGIGLLELMMSLAIIAILLIMAMRYYSSVQASRRVNDGVAMMQTLTNGCVEWHENTGSFTTEHTSWTKPISMQNLIDNGLIPDNYDNQNINPWGGAIDISPDDSDTLTIILTAIPEKECNFLSEIMAKKGFVDGNCPPSGGYSGRFLINGQL